MELHEITPVTACTDGSFKIANRPLSGMFGPPAIQEISAGGAIVFAGEHFDPTIRNAHLYNFGGPAGVIRITNGYLVSSPSFSLMEMLSTLLLQQIRFHYWHIHKHRMTAYTDCQSNIKIYHKAKPYSHRSLVSKYDSEIYHNLVESYIGDDIQWVPGHLDRDKYKNGKKVRAKKSLLDLAHHEWLNIIADKYSSYTPLDIKFLQKEQLHQSPVHEVPAQSIIDSLGGPGRITWALNGRTVRDNLVTETSPAPPHHYLQKRELCSVGHTPWTNLSTGLLLPMLHQNRRWRTPGKRLGLLRLIWDYLPHGRNQVKGNRTFPEHAQFLHQQYWDSLPRCPLGCNFPYDRHHILLECQNTSMRQVRQAGFDALQMLIQKLAYPYLIKYWELVTTTLLTPDPNRLTNSIMIGCPYLSHLNLWDASMPTRHTRFSQPDLDKATRASAPLFNHLFCLSRNLWYTYCQAAHPKQMENKPPKSNMQQVLNFSQSSDVASTPVNHKAHFKDSPGFLQDSSPPSPLDYPIPLNSPTVSLVDVESVPHVTELKWEEWNNIK
jgi:hypothetical protein